MGKKFLFLCIKFFLCSRILKYLMPNTHAVLLNLTLYYGLFSRSSLGKPPKVVRFKPTPNYSVTH